MVQRPYLAVDEEGPQMGTSSPSPSLTGPAPRPQGQVCLAGLAGHLRGQLDGLCALLVLFRALPRARLPGGDRKSAWALSPDPRGVLRDLVGRWAWRWGSREGWESRGGNWLLYILRVDSNVETWLVLQRLEWPGEGCLASPESRL